MRAALQVKISLMIPITIQMIASQLPTSNQTVMTKTYCSKNTRKAAEPAKVTTKRLVVLKTVLQNTKNHAITIKITMVRRKRHQKARRHQNKNPPCKILPRLCTSLSHIGKSQHNVWLSSC